MCAPASTWASASADDAAEIVAGHHLGRQDLAAGGVDALTDDDKGRSKPMRTSLVGELSTVIVTLASKASG
jgi:hypothetical protein